MENSKTVCWYSDYNKVLDVILSCQNIDQLKSASNMLGLWYDKHLDYQIYSGTFKKYIETKSIELGCNNLEYLTYRTNKNVI